MNKVSFFIPAFALLLLMACSDNIVTAISEDRGTVAEDIVFGRMACYTSTSAVGLSNADNFSSDAEWVTFIKSRNGSDSIYIEENGENDDRVATIQSTDNSTGTTKQFELRQLGRSADNTSINTPQVFNKTFGAGWGYDGNSYYGDVKGVREQILNPIKIQLIAQQYAGEHLVLDEGISETVAEIYTGETSTELSSNLGAQVGIGVSIPLAFSLDINARFQKSDMQSGSRTFAVNHYKHVIKRRSVGIQNLVAIQGLSQDCFTYGFKQALRRLEAENYSTEALKDFIDRFGNCIVSVADIGGCMDYNLCIEKQRATSTNEVEISAKVGLLSLFSVQVSVTNQETCKRVTENSSYSLTARGGVVSTLGTALLKGGGDISSQSSLDQWIYSINSDNSEMVGCQLTPIWDILPSGKARSSIKQYVTNQQSQNEEYALTTPTSLKAKFAIPKFAAGAETLIKVGKAAGQPSVEFCEEYIPTLNVLSRVRVAYPVKNGKPDYHRGVFPGDGSHQPGYIYTKTDGSRVYEAFGNRSYSEILDSIYYSDFELFDKPTAGATYALGNVSDYFMETYNNESKAVLHQYSVVKVGSNIWMRNDLLETDYLSPCSMPIRYVVQKDDTTGRCFYKSSQSFSNSDVPQSLLPVGYTLPSYNDVDTLFTITNGKNDYLTGNGISGLDLKQGYYSDYLSKTYDNGNSALMIDNLNGKVSSVKLSTNGLSVLIDERAAVPIRAIRSTQFEYH